VSWLFASVAWATPTLRHELGVGLAVGYQGGAAVVAGGLGGDLSYRLGVGDHLVAHATVGPRLYLAPALEVGVGAGWVLPLGESFSVTIGAEVAAMAGGVVRRITELDTVPLAGPPLAARVFVRPVEVYRDELVVRVLGLGGGVGLDGRSLAIGVDLFEVGLTL
jgi:hypothetical protein